MKSYRVVLRTHGLRRDTATIILLQKYLQSNNIEVIITNSSNHNFVLKYWHPHLTVMNVSGKIEYSHLMCPDTKIVLLHSEGANRNSFNFTSKSLFLLSKILLWGKASYEFCLEKYGKHIEKKLVIVGNNRLDLVKYHCKNILNDQHKKSIGFVGRFTLINPHDSRPTITFCLDDQSISELVSSMNQFYIMYKAMKYVIKETDFFLSIRPHPFDSVRGYEFLKRKFGNRIEIDSSMDVAYWINKQKLLITPASSTFIEANLLQVPCINIDRLAGAFTNEDYTVKAYNNAYTPKNFDELIHFIETAKFKPNEEDNEILKLTHNYFEDGYATVKIGKVILDELNNATDIKALLPIHVIKALCFCEFLKAGFRRPQYLESNYMPLYHRHPKYIDEFAKTIITMS